MWKSKVKPKLDLYSPIPRLIINIGFLSEHCSKKTHIYIYIYIHIIYIYIYIQIHWVWVWLSSFQTQSRRFWIRTSSFVFMFVCFHVLCLTVAVHKKRGAQEHDCLTLLCFIFRTVVYCFVLFFAWRFICCMCGQGCGMLSLRSSYQSFQLFFCSDLLNL